MRDERGVEHHVDLGASEYWPRSGCRRTRTRSVAGRSIGRALVEAVEHLAGLDPRVVGGLEAALLEHAPEATFDASTQACSGRSA